MRQIYTHASLALPAAALLAALAGCDRMSPAWATGPEAAIIPVAGDYAIAGGATPVEIASGDFVDRYSFEARRQADLSVMGRFAHEVFLEGQLAYNTQGFIVCMMLFDDKTASVVGRVTSSSEPYFEGRYVIFTVRDNGEGTGIPDDVSLGDYLADFVEPGVPGIHNEQELCAAPPLAPMQPTSSGNVQVQAGEPVL